MIRDLSAQYGKAFASESGLRRELWRRTGYVCGERSIGRVIARLVAQGEVGHERVKPNRKLIQGATTYHGGQHNWLITRRAARKARRRAADEQRQAQRAAARHERERLEADQRRREEQARERAARAEGQRAAVSLASLVKSYQPPAFEPGPVTEAIARELEEHRRAEVDRQVSALRDLAAQWDRDDKRGRPPD